MVQRILAIVMLLLGVASLLISLGCGVGAWIVKRPVTDKATMVFGHIDGALAMAQQNLDLVKIGLNRAADRLNSARDEQRQLAQAPQQNPMMRRMLARQVQQRVAPEISESHEKLHTVAEAAIVVNSVLGDFGDLPFVGSTGLDLSGLTQLNDRIGELGPAAWELSRLLGDPAPDANATGVQFSRIEQSLKSAQLLISTYEPRLTEVRERSAEARARTLQGITPAVVLISVFFFWVAISQLVMLYHGWRWLTKS